MKTLFEAVKVPKATGTAVAWVDVTHAGATEYVNSGIFSFEYALGAGVPTIEKGITAIAGEHILTPDSLQKIYIKQTSEGSFYISPIVEV